MRDAFNEFITSKKALPFDTPKSNLRWNNSESKVCVIGVDDVGHVVVAVIRCEITAITSQERSLAKSSAAASHSSLQTLLQFNGCQSRCTLRYLHHCHMAVDERSHSATNQSVCATIYAFIHWIHALVENARAKWVGSWASEAGVSHTHTREVSIGDVDDDDDSNYVVEMWSVRELCSPTINECKEWIDWMANQCMAVSIEHRVYIQFSFSFLCEEISPSLSHTAWSNKCSSRTMKWFRFD